MNHIDIFELRREIVHIIAGIAFVIMVLFIPYAQFILFSVLILGGFLSFLSTQYHIPMITRCLCLFERECNKTFPGKGVLFFFVSSLISLQLFDRQVAIASVLILTFSDPLSHFMGSNFGKTCLFTKRKYIEGTIVGILAGTFFAGFFVNPFVAFAGAFAAMFLEAVEIAMAGITIDDNLLIPLVAGTVMHFLILRFGI